MAIEVNVLGKYEDVNGMEVEIGYTCPHCGESVTESIFFSASLKDCIADVDSHQCPECGEENALEVDLY